MDLVKEIVNYICGIQKEQPISVAFDGVDTSGKTTFANRVHEELKRRNKNSIRIYIDRFHNPKEIRMQRGELSPEGFFYDSFNIAKIIELVLEPIKTREGEIIHGLYDYKLEKDIQLQKTQITNDLIVLFDGIFLNRDELMSYWNISIFLDISFDTVLKRALERDIEYFGSAEEVERRYKKRYIPGEAIYLSKCLPKDRANIVIDNNDYNNRKLIKGNLQLTIAST